MAIVAEAQLRVEVYMGKQGNGRKQAPRQQYEDDLPTVERASAPRVRIELIGFRNAFAYLGGRSAKRVRQSTGDGDGLVPGYLDIDRLVEFLGRLEGHGFRATPVLVEHRGSVVEKIHIRNTADGWKGPTLKSLVEKVLKGGTYHQPFGVSGYLNFRDGVQELVLIIWHHLGLMPGYLRRQAVVMVDLTVSPPGHELSVDFTLSGVRELDELAAVF